MAWLSAAILACGIVALRFSLFAWDVRAQMIAIPVASTLASALVFAASEQLLSLKLSAVLCNQGLIYFGKRSYALYLIHEPIAQGLLSLFGKSIRQLRPAQQTLISLAMALFGIAVSIGLAEISWRFVEQPSQRLKKRHYEGEENKGERPPMRLSGKQEIGQASALLSGNEASANVVSESPTES